MNKSENKILVIVYTVIKVRELLRNGRWIVVESKREIISINQILATHL